MPASMLAPLWESCGYPADHPVRRFGWRIERCALYRSDRSRVPGAMEVVREVGGEVQHLGLCPLSYSTPYDETGCEEFDATVADVLGDRVSVVRYGEFRKGAIPWLWASYRDVPHHLLLTHDVVNGKRYVHPVVSIGDAILRLPVPTGEQRGALTLDRAVRRAHHRLGKMAGYVAAFEDSGPADFTSLADVFGQIDHGSRIHSRRGSSGREYDRLYSALFGKGHNRKRKLWLSNGGRLA